MIRATSLDALRERERERESYTLINKNNKIYLRKDSNKPM